MYMYKVNVSASFPFIHELSTTDFLKRPVDTYARLDESTCLFCDYSESPVNVEDWTLGMSAATDQCDSCVISDGNLCFNGVTADEFATYVCFVQLPFGVQKSCSVNLLQPGEGMCLCVCT